jgi:hypothetical protein
MSESEPICEICELPATAGGIPGTDIETVCPACEDAHNAPVSTRHPPARRGPSSPAHANTTR